MSPNVLYQYRSLLKVMGHRATMFVRGQDVQSIERKTTEEQMRRQNHPGTLHNNLLRLLPLLLRVLVRQELHLCRQRTGEFLPLREAKDAHFEVPPHTLDPLPQLVLFVGRSEPRPYRQSVELRSR